MRPQSWTLLKVVAAVVLVGVAAGFAAARFRQFRQTGEEGATVWFYDQSAKRLYEAPRQSIPAQAGVGGRGEGGVRAVVVCFRGEQADPHKRRIAYLETYAPALRELLERAQAARASGHVLGQRIPPRDSAFFQTNDLVKRPEESGWHAASSPEGQKIMAEWRSWRAPGGQTPVVCLP